MKFQAEISGAERWLWRRWLLLLEAEEEGKWSWVIVASGTIVYKGHYKTGPNRGLVELATSW